MAIYLINIQHQTTDGGWHGLKIDKIHLYDDIEKAKKCIIEFIYKNAIDYKEMLISLKYIKEYVNDKFDYLLDKEIDDSDYDNGYVLTCHKLKLNKDHNVDTKELSLDEILNECKDNFIKKHKEEAFKIKKWLNIDVLKDKCPDYNKITLYSKKYIKKDYMIKYILLVYPSHYKKNEGYIDIYNSLNYHYMLDNKERLYEILPISDDIVEKLFIELLPSQEQKNKFLNFKKGYFDD